MGEIRIGTPTRGEMVLLLPPDQQSLVWVLLQEYKEKLQTDLHTRFDNSPRYTDNDDGTFLRDQLREVAKIETKMLLLGYRQ